ncbi:MAG: SDR family NAD(P)-dependent oxidoreductase, partial [Pseudomonadota bacterium]
MTRLIVTGASSGIGQAVAEMALEAGWQVGLVARRAELLEAMAAGRETATALAADVSDLTQVERAFADFTTRAGGVDVLFNNAGIFTPQGRIDEIDPADWTASVAVNLTGMFNCARV